MDISSEKNLPRYVLWLQQELEQQAVRPYATFRRYSRSLINPPGYTAYYQNKFTPITDPEILKSIAAGSVSLGLPISPIGYYSAVPGAYFALQLSKDLDYGSIGTYRHPVEGEWTPNPWLTETVSANNVAHILIDKFKKSRGEAHRRIEFIDIADQELEEYEVVEYTNPRARLRFPITPEPLSQEDLDGLQTAARHEGHHAAVSAINSLFRRANFGVRVLDECLAWRSEQIACGYVDYELRFNPIYFQHDLGMGARVLTRQQLANRRTYDKIFTKVYGSGNDPASTSALALAAPSIKEFIRPSKETIGNADKLEFALQRAVGDLIAGLQNFARF